MKVHEVEMVPAVSGGTHKRIMVVREATRLTEGGVEVQEVEMVPQQKTTRSR